MSKLEIYTSSDFYLFGYTMYVYEHEKCIHLHDIRDLDKMYGDIWMNI